MLERLRLGLVYIIPEINNDVTMALARVFPGVFACLSRRSNYGIHPAELILPLDGCIRIQLGVSVISGRSRGCPEKLWNLANPAAWIGEINIRIM